MSKRDDLKQELINVYESFLEDFRIIYEEKIIVLDEVSELLNAIHTIENRLAKLYANEDADPTA